jgi:hypothetical protein
LEPQTLLQSKFYKITTTLLTLFLRVKNTDLINKKILIFYFVLYYTLYNINVFHKTKFYEKPEQNMTKVLLLNNPKVCLQLKQTITIVENIYKNKI